MVKSTVFTNLTKSGRFAHSEGAPVRLTALHSISFSYSSFFSPASAATRAKHEIVIRQLKFMDCRQSAADDSLPAGIPEA